MNSYQLDKTQYVTTTPAGAYYAVSSMDEDIARRFLLALMTNKRSPHLDLEMVQQLSGIDDEQQALALLYRVQQLGWLQGFDSESSVPEGRLEELVPTLLEGLSASEKALLADAQGFYLAAHGFSHETAEEVSALSADLLSLHQRHHGLLRNNVGLETSAWALVNAAGDSKLGFWPIYLSGTNFTLIMSGMPQLNQSNFSQLIWYLCARYNEVED